MIQLTINDIKQQGYCERIPFYNHFLDGEVRSTKMMDIGRAYEDKISDARIRREFYITYGTQISVLRHMRIIDPEFGLSGSLDYAIIRSDRYYPLEVKFSETPEVYIDQLAAYALLLERKYRYEVRTGYFYYGYGFKDTLKEIDISEREKYNILEKAKVIRQNLLAGERPSPVINVSKCHHCEYRNFCNDIL